MSSITINTEQGSRYDKYLKTAQKYATWALAIAASIHMAIIGTYWLAVYWDNEEPPVRTVRILKYSELGPPPSISGMNESVAPSVSVSNPAAKPQIGIPVPVPDAEVSPEQNFLTQDELSKVTSSENVGTGQGGKIENDVRVENIPEDAPPADYVPVDIQPQIVKLVKPVYPEIARKAGMEGTVWVKLWVTTKGAVKDVQIVKSDAKIFNQAAIDAAKQFIFTPAISKAGPVQVWITFPFNFKLREGS